MKFFGILAFVFLALVAVVVADSGVVEREELLSTCDCDFSYFPICGSDNFTYGNHCTFECAKKKLAEKGVSLVIKKNGHCTGI